MANKNKKRKTIRKHKFSPGGNSQKNSVKKRKRPVGLKKEAIGETPENWKKIDSMEEVKPLAGSDTKAYNDKKRVEENNSHLAKWSAPEFIMTNEEKLFYCAAAAVSVAMVAWSLYQRNFVPAFTFALLAMVVILHVYRKPGTVECVIDLDGITIGPKLYVYNSIESFEVAQKDELDILKFRLKNSILPNKEIYLGNQDPHYILAALRYFLPEEKQVDTLFNFERKNIFRDEYEDVVEYKDNEEISKIDRN